MLPVPESTRLCKPSVPDAAWTSSAAEPPPQSFALS
eukprot:CAMPEP_0206609652 /NCGR_PEP_ID=MMETSP0325_2-20121206/53941_1 /ASSEMBLY_ACC=CAM_ASM_000347 /TAXON_ID=2866 /ORGANISM="Crypthecodinium cohnii, Strain Seligo" /LENGTH=35 /DNA_ID= /DNA_START= /DNA_END= /DNA_ORIENTATION=